MTDASVAGMLMPMINGALWRRVLLSILPMVRFALTCSVGAVAAPPATLMDVDHDGFTITELTDPRP